MKLKALLAALFVAGLAASIALASPSSDGSGMTTSASTATSTTGGHGEHGKNEHGKTHGHDENGDHAKCRNVELKGTVAAGSLSVSVTKANKRGHDLVGQSASLSFSGKVSVKARMCAAGGATTASGATLQLRVLKVEEHPAEAPTTTTTTTTTTNSTP